MKKYVISFFVLIFLILSFVTGVNYYVLSFSNDNYFYDVDGLDDKYLGLVFGASIINNKYPSDILKDRLKVAYEAYNTGKIKKIIVSGDNSKINYNEPEVMKNYLVSLGVKEQDIYQDYAGFDTYDSLYRAREIFDATEIVLFTQDFHLKRAMYIGNKLGLQVYGVETNLQKYIKEDYNNRREVFARIKAFFEIEIFKNKPKYLGDKVRIISDEQIEDTKKKLLEDKSE
ncbi:MAG: ElyC/SanA/YdcF family protein [Candidatus Gracilibacteria bacterium]|nr:ElyC/SanA/YdcF family protein [Candidatus Gracilibacteria bacterium]